LRFIGRSQTDLLIDPAQQMRYGYVSGNLLRWVDPLGFAKWTGTATNLAVAVGVGGTGSKYELSADDPVTGETVNVTVGSNLIVAGLGVNVSATVSEITFEDKNERPDPSVFMVGLSEALLLGELFLLDTPQAPTC